MTADELEALVLQANDPMELADALAPLDEAQRAKLSVTAQKLFSQLQRNKANESGSPRLKAFLAGRKGKDPWESWHTPHNRFAALALHGVGPLTAVRHRDAWIDSEVQRRALDKIIRDRRPDWLDAWIDQALEQPWPRIDFGMLRGWIRDGICAKPTVDAYYRQFAGHLMSTGFFDRKKKITPISQQLLADPAMLDDIEGLFRVEHIGFNTNEWMTRGAAEGHETWPEALVKLTEQGHYDRERLFGLALQGLRLDLKQNQLSGFHSLYRRMAPTSEEQSRHQTDYVELLCHPVGHVAKFAIDMLTEVEKHGTLETGPVVREIPSVFARDGKGNALAALKLLKRIIARTKDAGATLPAVCEALRHSHADVQSLALELLEANRDALGPSHLDSIANAEAFVSASNRGRLSTLLAGFRKEPDPGTPAGQEAAIPPSRSEYDYRPISNDINSQRILFDEDALQPIASIDELIESMLHAVEVVDSPDEVERIIDAISRFAGDRSFDFDSKVAPLVHRIESGGPIVTGGLTSRLLDLMLTWLKGKLYCTPDSGFSQHSIQGGLRPLTEHLQAITIRVSQRKPAPLVSAPSHKGGWIDPRLWVERLVEISGDTAPGAMDFRLSMLRLAPDHRQEALIAAGRLNSSLGRVARFALGGDELPQPTDRADWANWITAARCRSPLKDWSAEFAPLNLHDELPDGIHPARYQWKASSKTERYRDNSWKVPVFTVAVRCGDEPDEARPGDSILQRLGRTLAGQVTTDWTELPTAGMVRQPERRNYFWRGTSDPWLSYIWPQNPSAAYVKSALDLVDRVDENASGWTPSSHHFQGLFQKNRPWLEPGHLLVAMGIASKDADAKGLAVDALIEGIEDRRFDPSLFASVMARLSEGEWVKYNRVGDALAQVVAVSQLHAAVVSDALQQWLPTLDLKQRNSFRLLEVLAEALAASSQSLSEPARTAVAAFKGGGKTGKLARQLLAA